MKWSLVVLSLAVVPTLSAHDFWIEPSIFRPKIGTILDISLRQGEHFVGDAVPRDPSRIEKFIAIDAKGERPIEGMAGFDPAGFIQVVVDGPMILAYRTKPKRNEPLAADRFEAYLRLEGLEHISELRAKRGDSAKPGLEMFSRSVKSLLYTGKGTGPRFDKPLGLRLEIVPESDPYTTAQSKPLKFRVLFEGKPIKDILVFALNQNDANNSLKARSGKDGRVTFELAKPGEWLVKAVHMIPAPPQSGLDWESIWASVTFER